MRIGGGGELMRVPESLLAPGQPGRATTRQAHGVFTLRGAHAKDMLTHPDIALATARERIQVLLDEAANDLLAAQLPCGSEPKPRSPKAWTILALFGANKPCLEPATAH
jgi:hypothetical protein